MTSKSILITPSSMQGAEIVPFCIPALGDGTPQQTLWFEDEILRIVQYEREQLSSWMLPTEVIGDGRILLLEQQDLFLHCAALFLAWPDLCAQPTALAAH